jgi:hypothetical protein
VYSALPSPYARPSVIASRLVKILVELILFWFLIVALRLFKEWVVRRFLWPCGRHGLPLRGCAGRRQK